MRREYSWPFSVHVNISLYRRVYRCLQRVYSLCKYSHEGKNSISELFFYAKCKNICIVVYKIDVPVTLNFIKLKFENVCIVFQRNVWLVCCLNSIQIIYFITGFCLFIEIVGYLPRFHWAYLSYLYIIYKCDIVTALSIPLSMTTALCYISNLFQSNVKSVIISPSINYWL